MTDWHGQKNYSDELNDLARKSDVRSTLRLVGLCLFVVRNQIFHGGNKPTDENEFLHRCQQLTESIYRESLCNSIGLT